MPRRFRAVAWYFIIGGIIAASAMFAYWGIIALVGGSRTGRLLIMRPGERLTPAQWVMVAVGVAVAAGLDLGFDGILRRLSYRMWVGQRIG